MLACTRLPVERSGSANQVGGARSASTHSNVERQEAQVTTRRSHQDLVSRRRGRPIAPIGLLLLVAVGCTYDDVTVSDTESSALTTRYTNDGYLEVNVARNGAPSSSGAYPTQPVSTINDGQRGSPYNASLSQYAYWASSTTSTVYNCNYGNWWVSVKFTAPPGGFCPIGGCVHTISEIDLFSLQDNYTSGTDPTLSTTTTAYGNVDFHLLYCPAGETCLANGSGWVQPPGGYIIANNKAWTKVTFAPVEATAVRASFDCAQSTRAYAVELEAWERQSSPACTFDAEGNKRLDLPAIPRDNVLAYLTDDNSNAAIVADSDRFWWLYFGDIDDFTGIKNYFAGNNGEGAWWYYGARAQALAQMYDLLAPVDFARAQVYLERLRQMANALLSSRDDKRSGPFPLGNQSPQPPYDPFHGRVMPAWGSLNSGWGWAEQKWEADPGMNGLLTYPMAAFARRVAEHPELFCVKYRQDAVALTTAVIETYLAFRPDMYFETNRGGYMHPMSYQSMTCSLNDTDGDGDVDTVDSNAQQDCLKQKWAYGKPLPWNLSFSNLKSMAEAAIAADSNLYQGSSWAGLSYYAREEAPLQIARNLKLFISGGYLRLENSDGAYWHWWPYKTFSLNLPLSPTQAPGLNADAAWSPEDTNHAEFTLRSLLTFWENRGKLDELLQRYGYSERIGTLLDATKFTRIANTFLRRIWYYDYTPGSTQRNLITSRADGYGTPHVYGNGPPAPTFTENKNGFVSGWSALAQFDPWVWARCRDSVYNPYLDPDNDQDGIPNSQDTDDNGDGTPDGQDPDDDVDGIPDSLDPWPALNVATHAALLRYREWWANQ